MDLILFGIQGSGKGTQSQKIAQRYDLTVFETGAELRHLAQSQNPLGQKVKSIIERGHLVPHQVVMAIVENFIVNLPSGSSILFDGLPRSQEQAEDLRKILQKLNRSYIALNLNLSQKEALKRLSSRRICDQCKTVYPIFYQKNNCERCGGNLITRSDDNVDSIKTRLETFVRETRPVIKDYKKAGQLIEIEGNQPIEKVTEDIFKELDKIYFQ